MISAADKIREDLAGFPETERHTRLARLFVNTLSPEEISSWIDMTVKLLSKNQALHLLASHVKFIPEERLVRLLPPRMDTISRDIKETIILQTASLLPEQEAHKYLALSIKSAPEENLMDWLETTIKPLSSIAIGLVAEKKDRSRQKIITDYLENLSDEQKRSLPADEDVLFDLAHKAGLAALLNKLTSIRDAQTRTAKPSSVTTAPAPVPSRHSPHARQKKPSRGAKIK